MKRRDLRSTADSAVGVVGPRLIELHAQEQALIRGLHEVVANRANVRVNERLGKITLAELEKSGPSIRSGTLGQHGIVTLLDAQRFRNQLERFPGIGSVTASRIRSIITRIATVTPEDSRFYSDPSSWNENDHAFVLILMQLERLRDAKSKSDAIRRANELRTIGSLLKEKTGVIAFLSRSNREEAERLYGKLSETASSNSQVNLASELDRLIEIASPSKSKVIANHEIVHEWRAKSATLLALAETILAEKHSQSDLGGNSDVNPAIQAIGSPSLLPSTLQARIRSFELKLSGFKRQLRGYQSFGARFALCAEGVILGDEMGLGKTMQSLAVAHHIAQENPKARILVIAPVSILENWRREAVDATDLRTYLLYGQGRDARARAWEREGGIAMTSYQTLRRLSLDSGLVIDLTIVDEAHKIKNEEALQTQAAYECLARSRIRILLTGTPMENRTKEFMFLLWLANQSLGNELSRQFGDGSTAHFQATKFRKAVALGYLRRNQVDVLQELPELLLMNEMTTLSSAEIVEYRQSLREGHHAAPRQSVSIGLGPSSSKMERLQELLEGYAEQCEKVLVFSSFLRVLDTVVEVAEGRVFRLDGKIPTTQRQRVVDEFTAVPGFAVLVMQIEVGGVGLNIQAASAIVIVEPQWKPSTEWQAIGCAYRMGQTRRVMVHRLLATDTIDERIEERLQSKVRIFNAIVRPSALVDEMEEATETETETKALTEIIAEERRRLEG